MLFSLFLHGSIWHLAGNMLFLWVFGRRIEDRLGPVVFTIFYLVAGMVAAIAQTMAGPTAWCRSSARRAPSPA